MSHSECLINYWTHDNGKLTASKTNTCLYFNKQVADHKFGAQNSDPSEAPKNKIDKSQTLNSSSVTVLRMNSKCSLMNFPIHPGKNLTNIPRFRNPPNVGSSYPPKKNVVPTCSNIPQPTNLTVTVVLGRSPAEIRFGPGPPTVETS